MNITPQAQVRIGQRFSEAAPTVLPNVGEPSWFAPLVHVQDDGESLALLLRVPESAMGLRVESSGDSVVVRARLPAKQGMWRAHRGLRVFGLPFEAPQGALRVSRKGDLVRVHVRRLHPDARKPPPMMDARRPSA